MIGCLSGTIHTITDEYMIILAGGVGYKVFTAHTLLASHTKEDEITLWTHLAVRENALDLYGFDEQATLRFFEKLLNVSGIGPKSALSITTIAPIETLISAIAAGDTSYLTKVSGIGNKTAQKIVLELKDKMAEIHPASAEGEKIRKEEADALDALVALGYPLHQVRDILKDIPESAETTNDKIKEALKLLS